jgi:hypothetical protein
MVRWIQVFHPKIIVIVVTTIEVAKIDMEENVMVVVAVEDIMAAMNIPIIALLTEVVVVVEEGELIIN